MGERVKIGGGVVDIAADMTNFDNAMNALPKKAADKMDAAMSALKAKMAQTKLELKVATAQGNQAVIQQLTDAQDRLQAKIDAVTRAATSQASALQNAARAQIAATQATQANAQAQAAAAAHAALGSTVLPTGPRDPRAVGIPDYSTWTKKGMIDFAALGATGKKAGQDIRDAGSNGAMGLMLLSQAIDDAQYGKGCRAAA